MKKIYIIAFISAIICGTLFFLFLRGFSSKKEETAVQNAVETVDVVVSVGEIAENTQITQEMLKVVKIPKDAANPNAVTKMEDVVGKFVNTKVYTMEQILSQKLYDKSKGESNGLSFKITKGMKAMTISVDNVSGVAGFISEGDYVDVLGQNSAGTSKEIASKIKVLKVGNKLSKDGELYSEITFEVSESECRQIFDAQLAGQIRLLLREKTDH